MRDHFSSTYALEPNTTYTSNGTTYTTNSDGHIVSFSGKPTQEAAPRSQSSQRNLDGKLPGDHAGHLMAASNGGSGKVDNLVPMDGKVNTRDYRAFEHQNNDLLMDGKDVAVSGELSYREGQSRPDAIMVTRDTTDPETGKVDTEHMSWTNTDMSEFENSGDWAALADEYDNPGAVVADDQGNIVAGAEEAFGSDMAAAADDADLDGGDHDSGTDNGADHDSDAGQDL